MSSSWWAIAAPICSGVSSESRMLPSTSVSRNVTVSIGRVIAAVAGSRPEFDPACELRAAGYRPSSSSSCALVRGLRRTARRPAARSSSRWAGANPRLWLSRRTVSRYGNRRGPAFLIGDAANARVGFGGQRQTSARAPRFELRLRPPACGGGRIIPPAFSWSHFL
jgi:hypothetical protein